MRRIIFYGQYATRSLRRSGHWTVFAILCVAAGVATVVTLRSLGLAITDSLLSNLRQYNHGDINLSSVASFGPFSLNMQRGADESSVFSPWQVERVSQWAQARGARIAAYVIASNLQIAPITQTAVGRPQFNSAFLIDPLTFALAGEIIALDPPGVPLRDLFSGGDQVVISQNLALSQNIRVGDGVYVSGASAPFIVRGIVPTEAEASINNVFASFFGFAYFDIRRATAMGLNAQPNSIGIVLPDGASAAEIEAAAFELQALIPVRDVSTTPWLLERNRQAADLIGRFIVAMGLGALLIGGVGIMNTMLVLVGRRTVEIATLKTFGLQGHQVATLFAVEAIILGMLGSLLGAAIGMGLSRLVNAYGEAFLQQRLVWRLHPEAAMYGLVLGIVVTLVFGVLPVLTATKVRPAIILRPNEAVLPRAGAVQALLALAALVIVLGIVAGQIMGPVLVDVAGQRAPDPTLTGILGVVLTLVLLALLVGVLWVIVWLVSRLPAFGVVDLRLALRNLTARRLRTSTTLLALTAGMFALSSITFFGLGAREILRFQFSDTLGGNIVVLPLLPDEIAEPIMNIQFGLLDGLEYRTTLDFNFARIISVDGVNIVSDERPRGFRLTALSRFTDNPTLNSGPVLAGRDLTADDRGKSVIVLAEQSALESVVEGYSSLADLGIGVGSTITLSFGRQWHDFEVVGIVGNPNGITPSVASAYLPPDAPGVPDGRRVTVIQVAPEQVDSALLTLTRLPLVFAVDATFADGLMKRLLDQMSAIPTVVGLLSLLAAAVIMANTVSLSTLERRRQIGILKAIGLKRERVLRVMLLENTLIGLLGGALGIGISGLGLTVLTTLGTGVPTPLPAETTPITIGLLLASVCIAWLATFLSARVVVGEQVAVVLRYD